MLYQILASTIHGKIYKNNNFKVLSPTWNENFELPDGSYSVFEIQDYFKYFIKKHETVTDNPPIIIFVNKIENVITFGINTEYYLKLLASKTMKLLGSTKIDITKNKNGENVSQIQITEVVLAHCNIVNNDYQEDSRLLYTLVPNQLFGQLLDTSPKMFIFQKAFYSEF